MHKRALALMLIVLAVGGPALGQGTAPTAEQRRIVARDAFRAFAEPFLGEWDCEIAEYDGKSETPVWTDRQKRTFRFTMTRHMLEERATLRTPDGREYEGGLHLTSYDPKSGAIVQHGFWLPTQSDPLFRIEGRIAGKGLAGEMRIRSESGEDRRPFVIRWANPDQWVLEVTDEGPSGPYLRERLTYQRRRAS